MKYKNNDFYYDLSNKFHFLVAGKWSGSLQGYFCIYADTYGYIPVRLNMLIETSGTNIWSTCNYTDVQNLFFSEIYINNVSTDYPIWAGQWKVNA
jgi:hypothetical protein